LIPWRLIVRRVALTGLWVYGVITISSGAALSHWAQVGGGVAVLSCWCLLKLADLPRGSSGPNSASGAGEGSDRS